MIETFLYENKILRTHNFFCQDCTFLKARGLENSCLLHQTCNVQITGLLHVKLVKEVDWKSVVKIRKYKILPRPDPGPRPIPQPMYDIVKKCLGVLKPPGNPPGRATSKGNQCVSLSHRWRCCYFVKSSSLEKYY